MKSKYFFTAQDVFYLKGLRLFVFEKSKEEKETLTCQKGANTIY